MGICLSCRSAHLPTAKLVIIQENEGGLIRELPKHVEGAEILRDWPGFFVCHADSMSYDEYLSPLPAEQKLQVEQLYFLLPVTKLRRPLSTTDMAALAVKASVAMERSRRHYKKLDRLRGCKITPSAIMMEQEVADTDLEMISCGQLKGEGFNSETVEWERVGVGLKARPVHYKMQRIASGRKRVNPGSLNGPWGRKLSTIYEERFNSLLTSHRRLIQNHFPLIKLPAADILSIIEQRCYWVLRLECLSPIAIEPSKRI